MPKPKPKAINIKPKKCLLDIHPIKHGTAEIALMSLNFITPAALLSCEVLHYGDTELGTYIRYSRDKVYRAEYPIGDNESIVGLIAMPELIQSDSNWLTFLKQNR